MIMSTPRLKSRRPALLLDEENRKSTDIYLGLPIQLDYSFHIDPLLEISVNLLNYGRKHS